MDTKSATSPRLKVLTAAVLAAFVSLVMASALADESFDWDEAERIADLPDFKVLERLRRLKQEVSR